MLNMECRVLVLLIFCSLEIVECSSFQSLRWLNFVNTTREKRQTCSDSSFMCDSGNCIDTALVCDGTENCLDKSDETARCAQIIQCPPFTFRCAYGACVDQSAKCDGRKDCADASDELLSECPGVVKPDTGVCRAGEFECYSGRCIDGSLPCDGKKDCDDGSDETYSVCGSIVCPGYAFTCMYGGCIHMDSMCDGLEQCETDGSDESPFLCGSKEKGCILPPSTTNGKYNVGGCDETSCQLSPGKVVKNAHLLFSCNLGFKLSGSPSTFCVNGTWLSDPPACEPVTCGPLNNETLDFQCLLNGQKVSCGQNIQPGISVQMRCKANFILPTPIFYDTIKCLPDGTWNHMPYKCVPECGKPNSKGTPFIANGVERKAGEFPWHLGVYKPNETDHWDQVCGASLVSKRTALSAAHCFWDEKVKSSVDKSEFRIAAGKYSRDWYDETDGAQKLEISELILPDTYNGFDGLYANDIAIIIFNVDVVINTVVRPVCIDWESKYVQDFLIDGTFGAVSGWGYTENNIQSSILMTAKMPFVNIKQCRKSVSFQRYLIDKFCAGYTNGTSVCPGDSGGGLAFESPTELSQWYLVGIVSIGAHPGNEKCGRMEYSAYTEVSKYLGWIRNFFK